MICTPPIMLLTASLVVAHGLGLASLGVVRALVPWVYVRTDIAQQQQCQPTNK